MQSETRNSANDNDNAQSEQSEQEVKSDAPTPPAPKDLLDMAAGSSILRDLDENQLVNAKVISISGGKPKQLTSIFSAKKKDGERFNSVSLAIGGNRLGRDENPREKVQIAAEEVMETVTAAKLLTDTVKVLELPPRLSTPEMTAAISELNTEVQRRCEEQQVEFIHTNGVFYLRNGDPNAALIDDDLVHPTLPGSKAILACMGLQVRDGQQGVAAKAAYKNKPKKRSSPNPDRTEPSVDNKAKKTPKRSAKKPQKKKNQGQNQSKQPMGGQTRFFGHASTGYFRSSTQDRSHIPPNAHKNTQEKSPTRGNSYQQRPQHDSQKRGWGNSHTTPERSPAAPEYNTEYVPQNGKFAKHRATQQTRQSSNPPGRKPWAQPAPDYTQERNCTDVCQLCNGVGHTAATCNAKDQPCYHCYRQGHYSRVCPYKKLY